MIDFLLTPIGIWVGLLGIAGATFLVGAVLSIAGSLWGEGLAFYSASAIGVIGIVGILPALWFAGATSLLLTLVAIYAIAIVLVALFAVMMMAAESSRGY